MWRRKGLKSKLSDPTTSKEGISKGDKVEPLCEIGEKSGVVCHGILWKNIFSERGSGQWCCRQVTIDWLI